MDDDRGPVTLAVTVTFAVMATIFVVARLFTRIFLVKSIKHEDWWIMAAWVVALGFSTSICIGVHYGLGLHNRDIGSVDRREALRKVEYAFSVLYNPSLLLTKTSIIVFFLNVMSKDVDPIFKWCNYLVLVLVNVAGVALTLLNVFQCSPVSSTFSYPTPANTKCTDVVTLYLSSAPVNVITDLAILFLPMPILTGMQLPRKQKIILVVTFGFGAFVTAVDVVRIAYLQDAAVKRLLNSDQPSRDEDDFSWYASLSFMWSAVEVNLGIICASVPTLKPLFVRFMPIFVHDSGNEDKLSEMTDQHVASLALEPSSNQGSLSIVTNPAAFRKPTVMEYSGDNDGSTMGFLNMLNDPEIKPPHPRDSRTTTPRASTRGNAENTPTFGFVNMYNHRNMLELSVRESLWPLAVVIVLFFLWGFAYGLLNTLNTKFQTVAGIGFRQGLGLQSAYFGGFFVGPLTLGQYILRKYGFKATMMAGLCVYGCGALSFWPSAVLTSYPALMVSNFIVAFGLSCLQIAANPYIALCGPLEYAETRLCFGQGFQTIGTIVAPLLAQKVLFVRTGATALIDVQWTYLGIAFFVIGLAVVFYYIHLPEASDEQLQAVADQRRNVYANHIGTFRIIWWTLALGIVSQWTYVGGQETIRGTTLRLYNGNPSTTRLSRLTAFDFRIVCSTIYMAGRFLSGFATLFLQPRKILLLLYTGLIICCALQMTRVNGSAALAIHQCIYLFQSGVFSLIFAIVLRGMGKHTKLASALVTAAISGGAVFPVAQWATENCCGLKFSFVVPLVVFAVGSSFSIYLNILPAARGQIDRKITRQRHRRPDQVQERESGDMRSSSVMTGGIGPLDTTSSVTQRKQSKVMQTKQPTAQHVESLNEPKAEIGQHAGSTASTGGPLLDPNSPPSTTILQLRRPSGFVGDLASWPVSPPDPKPAPGPKRGKIPSSSTGDADAISQCESGAKHAGAPGPSWDAKGEAEDDYEYHTFLRGR